MCSLFSHLIVTQYLGVLLEIFFMPLAAAMAYVFLFFYYKNPVNLYPDCSILNTHRPCRPYPFLDHTSPLS